MGLIEYIKEKTNDEVLFVYRTGSMLFCKNCKDKDVAVITKGGDDYKRIPRYEDCDIFCYSLNGIKKCIEHKQGDIQTTYLITLALAKGDNIIYGENPLPEFELFGSKNELVNALIRTAEQRDINSRLINGNNGNACLKQSIWLFANYFALVNNSLDFTAEQLEIIQKCHDNELPRSYAEDVYQKLLAMLPKQEPQEIEQPTISYDELVDSKIRARYTVSQEFAILRQRDTKPDEFAEYNAYCEQCKAEAKAELGIE